MRLIRLSTCLAGLALLGACQAGDSLLLSPAQSDGGDQQQTALGPVRPQDNSSSFPQNQQPVEHTASATSLPPTGLAVASGNPPPANNNVPAGPTTNPVQVAANENPNDAPPQGDGGFVGQAGPTPNPVQVGANEHPDDVPPQGDGGVAGQAGAAGADGPARQGSLAQAADARQPAEDSDTRAVIQSSGGLFGSQFQRQMNALRGGDRVLVNSEIDVDPETVVGNWNLSEEDGMRSCTIGFVAPENGNGAQASGGCSPVIGGIQSWGVFGEDLLLRDAQNSVVVRLRRSGQAWVGFTLQAGIPVVLSRG